MDAIFREYDIIQFHALGSSPFAVLPRLTGAKTVVSVRGLDGKRAKWGPLARWYLSACEWGSIYCPSVASVVSRELATHYSERYRANVTYIPNGVTFKAPLAPHKITKFGLAKG